VIRRPTLIETIMGRLMRMRLHNVGRKILLVDARQTELLSNEIKGRRLQDEKQNEQRI
jgi:hypothetical protein